MRAPGAGSRVSSHSPVSGAGLECNLAHLVAESTVRSSCEGIHARMHETVQKTVPGSKSAPEADRLLHLRPARHKETHETRDTRHETRKVVELGCLSTAAARIVRLAGSRAAAPRLMRSQALLERPHADHRVPAARGRWVWPPSQRLRERAACWCPFFSRMCVDGLVQRAEGRRDAI